MQTFQSYNFAGKRTLVRVDFNVPLDDQFRITDTTRIDATLPTLRKILNDGGSLVLMSHLGRPKSGPEDKFSLRYLVDTLSQRLERPVTFVDDCVGEKALQAATALQPGQVLLLENLRFYKEETKGDRAFAQQLAQLGEVYVNDAFGTAHRAHASTAIVAEFFTDKMAGLVMQAEIDNAERILANADKPFVSIMGGAKISDKILIIERLLDKVDYLLIGGAMAYTFFKAQGGQVGNSLVEQDKLALALSLLEKAKAKGVQLVLPQDSYVADAFANDANRQTADNLQIPEGFMGLDIGPVAAQRFADIIAQARTVLWNGPMGVFEMPNFAQGTTKVAEAIAQATAKGAFSLIGGGDSAAAVNQLGFGDQVSYISTGGGALLEYLEGKTLPGVAALQNTHE
ncbi:phosphoglycerate kinase [Eisenibacter elegans]|uniref:phosphoglycerate kinase n=1 Tax=Eisenibacter elegans TaxID=997 RepID=UPI00040485F7|nr:phosphoglycerate kinase [Eisenibacter elegans]